MGGGGGEWGDQSGSFCSNGCFYEQENPVTQFSQSKTYSATLRRGLKRGTSWNVYCCFKRHRTAFVPFFKLF